MSELAKKSFRSQWPLIGVCLVALLAMARSCINDWSHFDDDIFLTANPHYNPPTLATLGYEWSHPFRGLWTPITSTAWWTIARFATLNEAGPDGARLNPWLFHAFNVVMHCLASGVAFLLVRRVVRSTYAAIAGAIVFAAHPVQVEAVAWACGTKDLLAALFAMAAITLATMPRGRRPHAALAIASGALAMLSKPSAAVLPLLLVAHAWIVWKPVEETSSASPIHEEGACNPVHSLEARRRWIVVAVLAVIAVPILIIARRVQEVTEVPSVSLVARPIVALDALAMHLAHLAWPAGLCVDYGLMPSGLLISSRRFWTWLVTLAIASIAWRSRDRVLVGGLMIFIVALAPNLGLAPFQFQVYSTVADRYAYLAMLGAAIVVARLVEISETALGSDAQSQTASALSISVIAALSIALVPLSFLRCGDWREPDALWTRVLAINPKSSLAHNNLGVVLAARGDRAGAIAHFEAAATKHGPADGFALINLVQLHLRQREPDAAADAVIRLVESYRTRSDRSADLERQTIDRFAREIGRLDTASAARLRMRLAE